MAKREHLAELEVLIQVYAAMQLLKRNTTARRAKSAGRAEHARKINRDPDVLKKRSETMLKLWSSNEFREKQSEGMKTFYREHPERKEELSKIMAGVGVNKALWWTNNPEHRKKQSERMKAFWNNKENRIKMLDIISNPEHRKKLSESTRALWSTPEYMKKVSEGRKAYFIRRRSRSRSSRKLKAKCK